MLCIHIYIYGHHVQSKNITGIQVWAVFVYWIVSILMQDLHKRITLLLKKQWGSTIQPISISMKWTHLKPLNTKKAQTYVVRNPDPGLGQALKCGRVNLVNEIPTPPPSWELDLWQYRYAQIYLMVFIL